MNEAEDVRTAISQLTRAEFEIGDPGGYPVELGTVSWFLWCPEITQMREIPYINVIWANKEGIIYLDSMPLGNTTNWVESAYGEEAAARAMDLDFGDFAEVRSEFEHDFPLVGKRINEYERIVSNVSDQRAVAIGIFFHGRKGRATLRLRGKLTEQAGRTNSVERTVKALEEAWKLIEEHDSK